VRVRERESEREDTLVITDSISFVMNNINNDGKRGRCTDVLADDTKDPITIQSQCHVLDRYARAIPPGFI
jgi:hypothetical protein